MSIEKSPFTVSQIRKLLRQFHLEQITMSRFVEILNETVTDNQVQHDDMKEAIRNEVMKVYDQESSVDEVVEMILPILSIGRSMHLSDKINVSDEQSENLSKHTVPCIFSYEELQYMLVMLTDAERKIRNTKRILRYKISSIFSMD